MLKKAWLFWPTYFIFSFTVAYTTFLGVKNILTDPFTQTATLVTNQIKAGDNLVITYNVQRHWTDCEIKVERLLISKETTIPVEILLMSAGRYIERDNYASKVTATIPIPNHIPPGIYAYVSRYSYECNFLHRLIAPSVRTDRPILIQII